MIKLPEPAYSSVAHSVDTGDTPSTWQRTTVIVEGLQSYSADQLKQAIRDALEEAAKVVVETKEWKNGKWTSTICPTTADAIAYAIRKLKEDIQ